MGMWVNSNQPKSVSVNKFHIMGKFNTYISEI